MATLITKTAPTGLVDRHSLTQLDAQVMHATGVTCLGSLLEPGLDANGDSDPTSDRLIIYFDGTPDDATIDATIAAFAAEPASGPPPTEVEITDPDTWQTVWTHAVGDAMAAKVIAEVEVTCGAAAEVETATITREAIGRRRPGEAVGGVANAAQAGASSIPGCEVQAIAVGNTIAIQMRATMPSTLHLTWTRLHCLCEPIRL